MDEERIHEIAESFVEPDYPTAITDRYELLECFHSDNEHETVLMRQKSDGSLFVLKCYYRNSYFFEHGEEKNLCGVSVKGVPAFIAEYKNEAMRCVIFDYMEGETLEKYAEDNEITEETATKIALSLCDILEELHHREKPLIHRDIKPQNVIISPEGEVSLIDFGASRLYSKENKKDTMVIGTVSYAAPEQYGYAQTDGRTDIFSLGVLIGWMLTKSTDLSGLGNSNLEKVAAKCAAFDPKQRYQSVEEVKKALLASRPKANKIRRIRFAVLTAVLLAAAVLIVVWPKEVSFEEPLIREAVCKSLGKEPDAALSREDLLSVTELYLFGNETFSEENGYYEAADRWYKTFGERGSIHSLEDVKKLPHLKVLFVGCQNIEDISPLAALTDLERLELKLNAVKEVSVIKELNRLYQLGLNGNKAEDLSAVSENGNVRILDLCDTHTYDETFLDEMVFFDFLDISNRTESYKHLAGKTIRDLRVGWTGLSDLSDLAGVSGLERLEIYHTGVADLSGLAEHKTLQYIRLGNIPAEDFSVLLELPRLQEIVASEDQREKIELLGETDFIVRYE